MSTRSPIFSVNSPLPSGRKSTLAAFWSLAHSFMTKVSLTETQAMVSTPLALSAWASSSKRGTWLDEQVGVKAPGREKRTTFLPAKISLLETSFHSLF